MFLPIDKSWTITAYHLLRHSENIVTFYVPEHKALPEMAIDIEDLSYLHELRVKTIVTLDW